LCGCPTARDDHGGHIGDKLLKVQPNNEFTAMIVVVANPTPAQSTGQANIGSNADIGVKPVFPGRQRAAGGGFADLFSAESAFRL
jgi:hypothetical protein